MSCPRFDPGLRSCELIDQDLGWDCQVAPATCEACQAAGGCWSDASEPPRAAQIQRVLLTVHRTLPQQMPAVKAAYCRRVGVPVPSQPVHPPDLDWELQYIKHRTCGVNSISSKMGRGAFEEMYPAFVRAHGWLAEKQRSGYDRGE